MKRLYILSSLLVTAVLALTGCKSQPNTETADPAASTKPAASPVLEKISAEDAKSMMDESPDITILDVRTKEEYNSGHIAGAVLIPVDDIEDSAENILKDKSATILVYCRSGRRSALAAQALSELGFTSVYDFGGIIDWPYKVVTE